MTGANMPTKLGFFKALSFEELYKFDNENLLVGHRLITNPFYTVNVALVQVILTKNYRVLINTLVYNNTVIAAEGSLLFLTLCIHSPQSFARVMYCQNLDFWEDICAKYSGGAYSKDVCKF